MEVRKYIRGEEEAIWNLFCNTIHHVNLQHYNQKQIDAWAPKDLDLSIAIQKIREIDPFVVILDNQIVAYADIQESGYIDHFFCHHKFQRKGIGSFLFKRLEQAAHEAGINKLSADVSITAKPFFEFKGFLVESEQLTKQGDQELANYKMVRDLGHN